MRNISQCTRPGAAARSADPRALPRAPPVGSKAAARSVAAGFVNRNANVGEATGPLAHLTLVAPGRTLSLALAMTEGQASLSSRWRAKRLTIFAEIIMAVRDLLQRGRAGRDGWALEFSSGRHWHAEFGSAL
jgi:hypothetical protein